LRILTVIQEFKREIFSMEVHIKLVMGKCFLEAKVD
jgi:hypothetical protein